MHVSCSRAVEIHFTKLKLKLTHIKHEKGEDMCELDICILDHDQVEKTFPSTIFAMAHTTEYHLCEIVFV